MPAVHRDGDSRACGAVTVVEGNNNVYCNGKLVSVDNDPNSHGGGGLIAKNNNVFVNGKLVVNNTPEMANPDNLCPPLSGAHCNPYTTQGSPNVFVGD